MNCDYTAEGIYSGQRQKLWNDILGPEYARLTKNEKKKMRKKYAKDHFEVTPGIVNYDLEAGLSLDCCKTINPVTTPVAWKLSQQWEALKQARTTIEEERNMYAEMKPQAYAAASVQAAANPDADKIKHLSRRLEQAYSKLHTEAVDKFGFNDDEAPKSPKDLIERIKAGAFGFKYKDELTEDGSWTNAHDYHGSLLRYLDWRTKPADQAGFDSWEATTQAAKQKVEDTIKVLTPAEGLAALQAFESSTIN